MKFAWSREKRRLLIANGQVRVLGLCQRRKVQFQCTFNCPEFAEAAIHAASPPPPSPLRTSCVKRPAKSWHQISSWLSCPSSNEMSRVRLNKTPCSPLEMHAVYTPQIKHGKTVKWFLSFSFKFNGRCAKKVLLNNFSPSLRLSEKEEMFNGKVKVHIWLNPVLFAGWSPQMQLEHPSRIKGNYWQSAINISDCSAVFSCLFTQSAMLVVLVKINA